MLSVEWRTSALDAEASEKDLDSMRLRSPRLSRVS